MSAGIGSKTLQLPPEEEEQGFSTSTEARVRISEGRNVLVEKILARAKDKPRAEYGIELIDVRIKRINYVEKVRRTVYLRMMGAKVPSTYGPSGDEPYQGG